MAKNVVKRQTAMLRVKRFFWLTFTYFCIGNIRYFAKEKLIAQKTSGLEFLPFSESWDSYLIH